MTTISNGLNVSYITGSSGVTGTTGVFSIYDTNGDGLDAVEMAKICTDLNDSTDVVSRNIAAFFATLLVGGNPDSDGHLGLMPDADGDQKISKAEIESLAAAGGSSSTIESADFKALFGSAAGNGNTIDYDAIADIADGTTTYTWATRTLNPTSGTGTTTPVTADEAAPLILNLLFKILYMQMAQNYGGGMGQGYPGQNYPQGGYGQGYGQGYGGYYGGMGGYGGYGQTYGIQNPYQQSGGGGYNNMFIYGQSGGYNPYSTYASQGYGSMYGSAYGQSNNPFGALLGMI